MKTYLIIQISLFFIFLFSSQYDLSAQEVIEAELNAQENVTIQFFTKKDTTISRTISSDEPEIFEFNVTCSTERGTIDQDIKVIPIIDSVTTRSGDIELLTNFIFFPKEVLMDENSSYSQTIQVKVFPDTTDRIQVFKISLQSEELTFSKEVHELIVTTNPIAKTIKKTEFELLLSAIDTSKVGTIYLTKVKTIPIYAKVKVNQRSKVNTEFKTPLRDRLFTKRYQKQSETINIVSVKIAIQNGQIGNIEVRFSESTGVYTNKGPISLTNYDKKHNYTLHYSGADEVYRNSYITVNDFLNYTKAEGRAYFPSPISFMLQPLEDSSSRVLAHIGNPTSYFDVRAYTDTKGLSGEENGLVQTEISANFIANSNNIGRTHLGFAKFINVGLSLSKFDSKFDTLKVVSFETRQDFELLNILQRSNTAIHVEIDLLHGSRVHDAFFTIGHRLYNTRLTDSSSLFMRAFTPSFYTHIGGTIFASPRVNAKFKFPLNFTYVHDQVFTNYGRKWNCFISPEIEFTLQLKKSKKGEENERSLVFGRIRYFDMPFASGGNYWQIQTGIEIPFSNLFGEN